MTRELELAEKAYDAVHRQGSWEQLIPAVQLVFLNFAQNYHEQEMTPVSGAPNLDGVDDNTLYIVRYVGEWDNFPTFTAKELKALGRAAGLYWDSIASHILIRIFKAAPNVLHPCPFCENEMEINSVRVSAFQACCNNCGFSGPREKSTTEAIESVKNMGT